MLMLTTSDPPINKAPTNFVFNPTQPIPGADRPSGPQACAMAIQR